MRFKDFLLFTWLFEDSNTNNNKGRLSLISLIFNLIILYFPILVVISLITNILHIKNYSLVFQIFTIIYGILGIILIISNIIYKFKNDKK